MEHNVIPQASQTPSCPLLQLPPELRLLIYGFTHSLDLDLEIKRRGCAKLSEAWESTPLVKLAATCRLLAEETRGYVRSLPSSQRVALVDISTARGPTGFMPLRLRCLPCPMPDLRHLVVIYDFRKYWSTTYGFPPADQNSASDGAMDDLAYLMFFQLRRLMTDAAVGSATTSTRYWFGIKGLQPRIYGESYAEAVERILVEPPLSVYQPQVYPVDAERLARELFSWGEDTHVEDDLSALPIAVFEGRPLRLYV